MKPLLQLAQLLVPWLDLDPLGERVAGQCFILLLLSKL
jgi:hypothetical protein